MRRGWGWFLDCRRRYLVPGMFGMITDATENMCQQVYIIMHGYYQPSVDKQCSMRHANCSVVFAASRECRITKQMYMLEHECG